MSGWSGWHHCRHIGIGIGIGKIQHRPYGYIDPRRCCHHERAAKLILWMVRDDSGSTPLPSLLRKLQSERVQNLLTTGARCTEHLYDDVSEVFELLVPVSDLEAKGHMLCTVRDLHHCQKRKFGCSF
jgi:hypothetical protein